MFHLIMKRLTLIVVTWVVLLMSGTAVSGDLPRIVLLSPLEGDPPAKEVADIVHGYLKEVGIDIKTDVFKVESLPKETSEWLEIGKETTKHPGTIAVFGYSCENRECQLLILEPYEKSVVQLPVEIAPTNDEPLATALAATIREALLGPLLPEIGRLVEQGRKPKTSSPSPLAVWVRSPYENDRKEPPSEKRPWLWLEGGYQGDYSHPRGYPIHGPWAGVDFEPTSLAGVSLSAGWLGIHHAELDGARVLTHRLTIALSISLILKVGPAHLAIAPLLRMDVAFATLEQIGRDDKNEVNLDVQVGGLVTWHLPILPHLEAILGAGLMASVVSRNTDVYVRGGEQETVIPASMVRMIWLAGMAWSPIG